MCCAWFISQGCCRKEHPGAGKAVTGGLARLTLVLGCGRAAGLVFCQKMLKLRAKSTETGAGRDEKALMDVCYVSLTGVEVPGKQMKLNEMPQIVPDVT